MKIEIKTIPHNVQRYDTVGDWEWIDGDLIIRVSEMNNWKYEMLVAFHEMAEALLCKDRNIREEDVTAFDIEFEKNRVEGNQDEPGNDERAPYKNEHKLATQLEYLLAGGLNVDWEIYDSVVNEL